MSRPPDPALAPVRYRDLLARQFVSGETLPQIAGTFGVTPSTVDEDLGRDLGHIRAAIA